MNNKCPFCGGQYIRKSYGIACMKCDRTPDIEYEMRVKERREKEEKLNGRLPTTKWEDESNDD